MGRKTRVERGPEEEWQIVQEGMKSGNVSETCRPLLLEEMSDNPIIRHCGLSLRLVTYLRGDGSRLHRKLR
jgi:hypothetical protein